MMMKDIDNKKKTMNWIYKDYKMLKTKVMNIVMKFEKMYTITIDEKLNILSYFFYFIISIFNIVF